MGGWCLIITIFYHSNNSCPTFWASLSTLTNSIWQDLKKITTSGCRLCDPKGEVLILLLVSCVSVVFSRRSGRRIRKTRKYDIITTPAERVEMAPLNEENDDEDDSTLFDVKYRLVCFVFISFGSLKQ